MILEHSHTDARQYVPKFDEISPDSVLTQSTQLRTYSGCHHAAALHGVRALVGIFQPNLYTMLRDTWSAVRLHLSLKIDSDILLFDHHLNMLHMSELIAARITCTRICTKA
jgi:hypothetical protein